MKYYKDYAEAHQRGALRWEGGAWSFDAVDEQENVIYIKGAMNLKQELTDQLELAQDARFFAVIEDQMFSKRESEMLQHFIIEHGKMPKINQEMEDLF